MCASESGNCYPRAWRMRRSARLPTLGFTITIFRNILLKLDLFFNYNFFVPCSFNAQPQALFHVLQTVQYLRYHTTRNTRKVA